MTHGTISAYANHRCRCEPCKRAHNDYYIAYGKMKRARGQCVRCKRKRSAKSDWLCTHHMVLSADQQRAYRARRIANASVPA